MPETSSRYNPDVMKYIRSVDWSVEEQSHDLTKSPFWPTVTDLSKITENLEITSQNVRVILQY